MKKILILIILTLSISCYYPGVEEEPRPEYEWLWPDNTIYYYFYDYEENTDENNIPERVRDFVRDASNSISNRTNAEIIEVSGKNEIPEGIENYVVIYKAAFSSSTDPGMQEGVNKMSIAFVDSPEDPLHEWGHELGLVHEQNMAYRDRDLIVHFDNIFDNERSLRQFQKTDYYFNKTSIDFDSMMLYDSNKLSKNGKPTVTKKDGSTFTGNKDLSIGDIETINYLYPLNI